LGLKNLLDNDLIIVSDLDEIPNLEKIELENIQNKIIIFKQKMFYYKLNLLYDEFNWFGSKACKKKNFLSPQWLRNIKSKKYPRWRLDLWFSKRKYINNFYVEDGGWHFTCIRTAQDLEKKLLNFAHHYEFEESGLKKNDLEKLINEKRVMYDHNVDQKGYKWSGKSKLKKINKDLLPSYVAKNVEKYKNWLD
jgi:beta-1,4-mannosyl-glycoprotein beta-1,4-N-acetylglucosaminyltransferase